MGLVFAQAINPTPKHRLPDTEEAWEWWYHQSGQYWRAYQWRRELRRLPGERPGLWVLKSSYAKEWQSIVAEFLTRNEFTLHPGTFLADCLVCEEKASLGLYGDNFCPSCAQEASLRLASERFALLSTNAAIPRDIWFLILSRALLLCYDVEARVFLQKE
jgi:hypothetical protein